MTDLKLNTSGSIQPQYPAKTSVLV